MEATQSGEHQSRAAVAQASTRLLDAFRAIEPVAGDRDWVGWSLGSFEINVVRSRQTSGFFRAPPLADFKLQLCRRASVIGRFDVGAGEFQERIAPGGFFVGLPGHHAKYDYDVLGADSNEHSQVETFMVGLSESLVRRAAQEHGLDLTWGFSGLHEGALRDPALVRLMELFDTPALAPESADPLFADSIAHAIIARLIGLARSSESEPENGQALSAAERQSLINFIDERVAYPILVADIARHLGRSLTSVNAIVRDAFGQTPYALVQERRLERAREFLVMGDLSLAEIAYASGFSSQAHFTTAFSRRFGVTPGVYRKQLRG